MKGRRFISRVLPYGILGLVMVVLAGATSAPAQSLHERIDALVEAAHVGPPARLANDAEFLRRVSLDLLGRIPTSDEARAFFDDTSPDKRTALVDRLLNSPEHVSHMATVLDIMLMERRRGRQVDGGEWRQYLYDAWASNKPFNELASEILAADGTDEKRRAAAKFYLDREAEPNLLTRDVGRMFFGMDLQCAQCHDHPLIADYLQSDYYGLFAFFSRTSLFVDESDEKKKAYLAESAEGDVTFKSVFTEEEGATGPRLPGGEELEEPVFAKEDAYLVKPDKNVRSVPKYSRRQRLAEEIARGGNLAFNRNIVNRMWALVMGRGLVDPVDLHHSDNPPVHAELLDMLAAELPAMNYNLRALLREIILSRTYQRSFEPPADWYAATQTASAAATELETELAEANARVEAASAAHSEARKALSAKRAEFAPQREAYDAARLAAAEAEAAHRAAEQALAASRQQIEAKQPVLDAVQAAAQASQAAAEKLPDAAEASAAAAKFKEHADKLAAELATLTAAVPEQEKALAEKAAALAAAQQSLATATEAWQPAAAELAALRQQVVAAAEAERVANNERLVIQRRYATAQVAANAVPVLGEAQAAAQTVAQLESQLAGVQAQIAQLESQRAERQSALVAAQQTHAAHKEKLAELNTQLTARRSAHELLVVAVDRVREASVTLPSDRELAGAVELLVEHQQRLTTASLDTERQVADGQTQLEALAAAENEAAAAVQQVESQLAAARQAAVQLDEQLAAARVTAEEKAAAVPETLEKLEQSWTEQLALAPLEPLTPEQLGWSILEATGVLINYRVATEAELKAKPEMASLSPEQFAVELEKAVRGKLRPAIGEFIRLFGAGAGQPQDTFFATVDQALFLANGDSLRSWLAPSGQNLVARLANVEDPAQLTEELYLSVFTRRPTDEETQFVTAALAEHPENRSEVLQELAWGLITSAEFRFRP